MTPETDTLVILTNTASKEEATRIANALVSRRLAACVNIFQNEASIYEWEGKLCQEQEFQLVIKTTRTLYEQNENVIRELHSYDLPEIIALPVAEGSRDYLEWIRSVTI